MNRIGLCVAALCVSLGLLAMPVAMAGAHISGQQHDPR